MSNSKTQYVLYKHYPPAVIRGAERRGRKNYVLLAWTNYAILDKWVRLSACTPYEIGGTKPRKGLAIPVPFSRGRLGLNWYQKIIVKLQNWWYGKHYNESRRTN